jgi:hypothetical protein
MSKNNQAPEQAEPASIEPADTVTSAKPRSPRRMARAPAGGQGTESPAPAPRGPSKISAVMALLERADGATLAELVAATGWLPHTARAALTGLRKKGHTIAKTRRDEATCYKIESAA